MFKKNLEAICAKKGISPTSVCVGVGLSNGTYSQWTDESVPRKTTLIKISDYLGVSVEDLLREDAPAPEEEKSPSLSESDLDARILEAWRQLDEKQVEDALRYIEFLKSKG